MGHQADRPQVHRGQGPPQAAGHQGRAQVRPRHRRREEAPPLQARYRGSPSDPQAPLPAPRPRDRPGLQDRPALPELRRDGPPGGVRGLPRRSLRGHQPVRHPRQARHHHAQGRAPCPAHPRRARLSVRSSRAPRAASIKKTNRRFGTKKTKTKKKKKKKKNGKIFPPQKKKKKKKKK